MRLSRLLVLLSAPALAAQGAAPTPQAERWRADLAHLAKRLTEMHKNLFFKTAKKDFDRAVADLDAKIPELQPHQIVAGMMRIVASVGDGHTVLTWGRGARLDVYPLKLYWFKDGLTVVRAPKENERAVGARLVSVGGMKAAAAVAALSRIISHDNAAGLAGQVVQYLTIADVLHAVGITKDRRRCRFVLQDSEGSKFQLELEALPIAKARQLAYVGRQAKPALFETKAHLDHWNEWLKDSRTLYFKYNRCRSPRPFQRLVRGTFNFIKKNPPDRFVLDLRDNGGGSSLIFAPLLGGLLRSRELNQRGKLFVIIGRRTFSSALLNALEMKRTNAIFFGEPTGGRPNHYGEVKFEELPHSKMRFSYSTKYFRRIKDADPPSLEPDVLVEPTSEDWLAGRDPVLAAVLAHKEKGK